ncbi:hypothetical protein SESBI_13824 [Sesbania bispinosa]|nr:hypothetical protein SESBI_13824 [Sesbania bispinosa]
MPTQKDLTVGGELRVHCEELTVRSGKLARLRAHGGGGERKLSRHFMAKLAQRCSRCLAVPACGGGSSSSTELLDSDERARDI